MAKLKERVIGLLSALWFPIPPPPPMKGSPMSTTKNERSPALSVENPHNQALAQLTLVLARLTSIVESHDLRLGELEREYDQRTFLARAVGRSV
jgi:hypothetical protein